MQTPFDWITVALFAGLIVLMLRRSTGDAEPRDSLWQYLVAATACAATNYIGNELGWWQGLLALAFTIAFIIYVLKPFGDLPGAT